MTNELEDQVNEEIEQAPEEPSPFYEFKGRRFDSKESLDAFIDGLSFAQGRLAQQKDELEREVAPFRQYNLKQANADDVTIMREVDRLRQTGDDDSAWKLMFEYTTQVRQSVQLDREFDKLLSDSPSFQQLDLADKDVYRDYIKRNYLNQLVESPHPLQLVESILSPKVAKKAPVAQVDDPSYASISQTRAPKPAPKKAEQKQPEKGAWDKLTDELGFK